MFIFPGLIGLIQLILLVFIFKFESPEFYWKQNDIKSYNEIQSLIYKNYTDTTENVSIGKKDYDLPLIFKLNINGLRTALFIGCAI